MEIEKSPDFTPRIDIVPLKGIRKQAAVVLAPDSPPKAKRFRPVANYFVQCSEDNLLDNTIDIRRTLNSNNVDNDNSQNSSSFDCPPSVPSHVASSEPDAQWDDDTDWSQASSLPETPSDDEADLGTLDCEARPPSFQHNEVMKLLHEMNSRFEDFQSTIDNVQETVESLKDVFRNFKGISVPPSPTVVCMSSDQFYQNQADPTVYLTSENDEEGEDPVNRPNHRDIDQNMDDDDVQFIGEVTSPVNPEIPEMTERKDSSDQTLENINPMSVLEVVNSKDRNEDEVSPRPAPAKRGPGRPKGSTKISKSCPAVTTTEEGEGSFPPNVTHELPSTDKSINVNNENYEKCQTLLEKIVQSPHKQSLDLDSGSTTTVAPIASSMFSPQSTAPTTIPNASSDHDYLQLSPTNSSIAVLSDTASQSRSPAKKRCQHKCRFCSKKFSRKPDLKSHEQRHINSETRPFLCKFCSKGFKTKSDARGHEKRHENARTRRHVCPICLVRFIVVADLRNHEKFSACYVPNPAANILP